ncbi:MAG TPA: hypothetical protein VFJ90_01190 [Candidatus Didemnitutus sp.]|nr:hypothetical protein [Candidatus Didemnitutus sp.]
MNHPLLSSAVLENPSRGLPVPGWACALGVAQAVLFFACLTLLSLP